MLYQNPILRGFNPDPSILCVDGKFLMVNSTFQYFPAIKISQSSDLINFHTIGFGITQKDWIDLDVPDSHGIWAPDISYANGRYWIFAPLRLCGAGGREHTVLRRQLIMWSLKPEGPYSKPAVLEVDQIDPSHFIDEDGRHYLISAPGITITPLSEDCSRVEGESVQAWAGTGLRAPEGPHILKKDGWYYAILAEGGTGYGHQVSVARARALYGPYEPCPHNPILKQTDPLARLQRCGHAKFMQLPHGRWVAAYLCARPIEGRLTVLGRETALQEMRWDDEGWPYFVGGKPASEAQAPYPDTVQELEDEFFDDFDSPTLGLDWQFVRTPSAEWSLTERPGFYRIWTQDGQLFETKAKNTLVHRETEKRYEAQTTVCFAPEWDGEQAGLCCLYGITSYISCALTHKGVQVVSRAGDLETVHVLYPTAQHCVSLRVRVDGLQRWFDCRLTGEDWRELCHIPDCSFLSDEGLTDGGKRHTGTMVGLFANNGGCGSRKAADFDGFRYRVGSRD